MQRQMEMVIVIEIKMKIEILIEIQMAVMMEIMMEVGTMVAIGMAMMMDTMMEWFEIRMGRGVLCLFCDQGCVTVILAVKKLLDKKPRVCKRFLEPSLVEKPQSLALLAAFAAARLCAGARLLCGSMPTTRKVVWPLLHDPTDPLDPSDPTGTLRNRPRVWKQFLDTH